MVSTTSDKEIRETYIAHENLKIKNGNNKILKILKKYLQKKKLNDIKIEYDV